AYADRSDLAVADPNSGKRFAPGRGNPVLSEKINEQLSEPPQILVQTPTASTQIDNRITHQLPRPVISGLAAAIDGEKRMRQMRGVERATANPSCGGQTGLIWSPPNGVNRFVLE